MARAIGDSTLSLGYIISIKKPNKKKLGLRPRYGVEETPRKRKRVGGVV